MASEPFKSDRQISALEKFATNNPDLEEMGRQAKEFDAFSVLEYPIWRRPTQISSHGC